jgi:3',5'-cyclic AMP phosphodiesterase CpdA
MPVYAIPGNHDIADPFHEAFGPPEFAVDVGDLRLVGVDTHIPGEDGGRIDLARLDAHLRESDRPTIVAMHHAPIPTGIPPMDAIGIREADVHGLEGLLRTHAHVKRIVTGHVHRAITGALAGVPVFVCPGTHWQLELDFNATRIETNDDPPGYALHLLLEGDVISHVVAL